MSTKYLEYKDSLRPRAINIDTNQQNNTIDIVCAETGEVLLAIKISKLDTPSPDYTVVHVAPKLDFRHLGWIVSQASNAITEFIKANLPNN